MGVPKFFRWMADRYPAVLGGVYRTDGRNEQSLADNLYLDMNGIIHNCSHTDESISASLPFDEILSKIFAEIDAIVQLVRPSCLLFIAVDGVAPRAKLNQQRSRRFRSAKERLKGMQDSGSELSSESTRIFDSNCITPGTEFMAALSTRLRAFIAERVRAHELWQRLVVHFSGSETPGEGEHKIISYIRDFRAGPMRRPNVRHCILGADADMIMLALATHEPFFLVLREALDQRPQRGAKYNQRKNTYRQEQGQPSLPLGKTVKSLQTIRINVLREYLLRELLEGLPREQFDAEHIVDDFVFLTFLVGNDFLPHLPAINIGDDAFDMIFDAYKTVLASEPGYLVEKGGIDLQRLETIFSLIGVTELSVYHDQRIMIEQRKRQQDQLRQQRQLQRATTQAAAEPGAESSSATPPVAHADIASLAVENGSDAVLQLQIEHATANDTSDTGGIRAVSNAGIGAPGATVHDREQESKHYYYASKFGIDISTAEGQTELRKIVRSYLQGLYWCLLYYSTGCCSWSWYYPYHYGPFLHDLADLTNLAGGIPAPSSADTNDGTGDTANAIASGAGMSNATTSAVSAAGGGLVATADEDWGFDPQSPTARTEKEHTREAFPLDAPLRPFQQLLACLPASSCELLPAPYHWLMRDPASPLKGFYPDDFQTDLNGKKNDYEAVVLLPFIDQDLLIAAEEEYVLRPPQQEQEQVKTAADSTTIATLTVMATSTGSGGRGGGRGGHSHRARALSDVEQKRNQFGDWYSVQLVVAAAPQPQFQSLSNSPALTGDSVILNGEIMRVSVQAHAPSIEPGVCFEAQLTPGTANALPLLGFPAASETIAATISYTRVMDNGNQRKGRARSNCYGKGKEPATSAATGSFPMLGVPSYAASNTEAVPPVSPYGGSHFSTSPSLQTTQLNASEQLQRQHPDSPQSAGKAACGVVKFACGDGPLLSLRLPLPADSTAATFLGALLQQLHIQVPAFQPGSAQQQASDSTASGAPKSGLAVHFFLGELLSAERAGGITSFEQKLVTEVLPKVQSIFKPVTAQLMSNAFLGIDGTVFLRFADISHLGQIEQFICQRLVGSQTADTLVEHGSTAACFQRCVAIGTYAAADHDRFQRWLDVELRKLKAYMPTFICPLIELVTETVSTAGQDQVTESVVQFTLNG